MAYVSLEITTGSPLPELESLQLGTVSAGLGTPDLCVLVNRDNQPCLRIDVYCGCLECCAFSQNVIWKNSVIIGFGHKVHFVSLNDLESREIDLGYYFGHLYMSDDYLLAASGERLFRLSETGTIDWVTQQLGIDGVVVDAVESGIIYGQGEWDPPGGWEPYQVVLETGLSNLE